MMSTLTFEEVLGLHGVSVPDETVAALSVPVLSDPQRQGDVMIVPRKPFTAKDRKMARPVLARGVAVVRGEATGNTHLLHAEGDVLWLPAEVADDGVRLGVVEVSAGAVAYLIHTDEHGANAMAPGTYSLHGKREQAQIVRRVAD